MAALVAGVATAVSILSTGLLFFGAFRALRGGSASLGKITVCAAAALVAIWQDDLLMPNVGRYLAYSLLPVVILSFLSVFFWKLRQALKQSPSGGPGVKTPAMAKRLPGGLHSSDEGDERQNQRIA